MVQEQAIACLTCGAADLVRSNDPRAVRWPAWAPGPHEDFCPRCGGTAWAAEPRDVATGRDDIESGPAPDDASKGITA
jgi:hypothetical protein